MNVGYLADLGRCGEKRMADRDNSNPPGDCPWPGDDPRYRDYHDSVWGRAVFAELELFEKLCLDGQQAGLAWITILRKQESYRAAYAGFDPQRIAAFTDDDIERLMQDPGIIRNRLKVNSIIKNARAFLAYRAEHGEGSFSRLLWSFVGGAPIDHRLRDTSEMPTVSDESQAMSKALKKLGFSFVGPTICYAFMQAVGMVNDHLLSCRCHAACNLAEAEKKSR